ncbi:serine hydrolase [Acidovorax sp. GW101-3H11]|uniref:serine hydrolase domain-containing protein n=1 Tax=Acidovorax sp. GW101-3H11 TaxID=1813946 RepID=UPI000B2B3B02|nr:serine hydrolase [Acidovorax sp. GW101-3H11]
MKRSKGFACAFVLCLSQTIGAVDLPRRTHIVHPPAERTYVLGRSSLPRELSIATDSKIEAAAKRAFTKDSLALLLIDKGGIAFEQYATDLNEKTQLFSLSITKSLVAIATGEALCAGKIKSLDDPAVSYSNELSGAVQGQASVKQLLTMSSGADPAYMDDVPAGVNFKDFMAQFEGRLGVSEYVRKDSRPFVRNGLTRVPGSVFQYSGRDTAAISLVIEGAVGMKFQEWFDIAVWRKVGAASDAFLRVASKDGRAIADGGLWVTPRDLARVGMMALDVLHDGNACMKQFMAESIAPHLDSSWASKKYGYQMWIDKRGLPQFVGAGGQMLVFDPKSQRILVVFGHNTSYQPMEDLFHH